METARFEEQGSPLSQPASNGIGKTAKEVSSSENIRLCPHSGCGCISEYSKGRCSYPGQCSPCDIGGNLFSVEYRQIEGQVFRVNVYAPRPGGLNPIIDADKETAAIRKNQEAHGMPAPVIDAEAMQRKGVRV